MQMEREKKLSLLFEKILALSSRSDLQHVKPGMKRPFCHDLKEKKEKEGKKKKKWKEDGGKD